MKRVIMIIAAVLLLLIAVLIVLYPMISNYVNNKYQSTIRTEYEADLEAMDDILTERQLCRYWLCVVCGHSRKELAAQEGVSSTAVVKSIRQAKSRIESSGIF